MEWIRTADHDLTAFLKFGLKGIESQCRSLFAETRQQVAKALVGDLNHLIGLEALSATRLPDEAGYLLRIQLDWPTRITKTEFFKRVKAMPKGKVYGFLSA